MLLVIITGVSPSSIGSSTASAIASGQPATLILASRTASKLREVATEIKSAYPTTNVKEIIIDLSSVTSIQIAAAQIKALVSHIDILINNAGISDTHRNALVTPNGNVVDLQFFTNHLGPFLLTELLLPELQIAGSRSPNGDTRIVNLSSHGHVLSPIRFSDYAFSKAIYEGVAEDERPRSGLEDKWLITKDGYPGFLGYGQSKSANILHAAELSRRLRQYHTGVVAFSVHPGSIETELSRSLDDEGKKTIEGTAQGTWKTIDQGAATTLVAAFDPSLAEMQVGSEGVSGYLSDCQLADHIAAWWTKDQKIAARLWQESERMLVVTSTLQDLSTSRETL